MECYLRHKLWSTNKHHSITRSILCAISFAIISACKFCLAKKFPINLYPMANIAAQRIQREFKEVVKSEEVTVVHNFM